MTVQTEQKKSFLLSRAFGDSESFRTQVLNLSLVSAFVVASITIGLTSWLYHQDRKAYLFEIQYHKIHSVSSAVERQIASIQRGTGTSPFEPKTTDLLLLAREHGIPRLPNKKETLL